MKLIHKLFTFFVKLMNNYHITSSICNLNGYCDKSYSFPIVLNSNLFCSLAALGLKIKFMKKLIAIGILTFVALKSNAQITILSSDIAAAGDTVRYSETSSLINSNQSGPNQVWDYSNLIPLNQDIQSFYGPNQLPFTYRLQFSSMTFGFSESLLPNLGNMGPTNMLSDPYTFVKKSSNAYVYLGRGASVQGIPLSLVYTPKDTLYKFPMNYLDSFSGNYAGSAGFAALGSLAQIGNRKSLVDAWGTLKTPYGTFDCIRIKSEVTEIDSITFSGTSFPLPNSRTEYRWFAKNQKIPVLEVIEPATLFGAKTIRYKDIYRPEVFVNHANFNARPNPVNIGDTLTLTSTSFGNPKSYLWEINANVSQYDFVGGTSQTSANPKVIFYQSGSYDIKLNVTYSGGKDDTLRVNAVKVNPSTTGYAELSKGLKFKLYPNPSNGVLFFEAKIEKNANYQILDLTGKLVKQGILIETEASQPIDISGLTKACYLFKIEGQPVQSTSKFVIE